MIQKKVFFSSISGNYAKTNSVADDIFKVEPIMYKSKKKAALQGNLLLIQQLKPIIY